MKLSELSYKKIFKFFLTIAVIGFGAMYCYFTVVNFKNKVTNAWDEIIFAYNYPELVSPLKAQFLVEQQSIKDSLIKRQLVVTEEPKKD